MFGIRLPGHVFFKQKSVLNLPIALPMGAPQRPCVLTGAGGSRMAFRSVAACPVCALAKGQRFDNENDEMATVEPENGDNSNGSRACHIPRITHYTETKNRKPQQQNTPTTHTQRRGKRDPAALGAAAAPPPAASARRRQLPPFDYD